MGRVLAWKGAASLIAYASVWLLMDILGAKYNAVYMVFGFFGLMATLLLWAAFPAFGAPHTQHRNSYYASVTGSITHWFFSAGQDARYSSSLLDL